MFSYNINIREKEFHIKALSIMEYDIHFLDDITEMIEKIEKSECERIYCSCIMEYRNFNKMGIAYLYNILIYFSIKKNVFVQQELYQLFHEKVSRSDGTKFKEIDIFDDKLSEIQQCYCIRNDKEVNQTVPILVKCIAKNNLLFNNAEEFLITTIGEIFSNAFNHSNENEVLFMYNIERCDEKFYLVINITDYGKNIIHNVQNYQETQYKKQLDSMESLVWALKKGNTTRIGSGGYGLSTLIDYVREVRGELLICSGDCIYELKGKKENIIKAKGIFMGTSVSMKLPLFDTSKLISYDKENNKIFSVTLDQI